MSFVSCRVAVMTFASVLAISCSAAPVGLTPGPAKSSATPEPASAAPIATGPRLIRDGARWAVTGLSPDAAAAVEQGRLFVVRRPIAGTSDSSPVAVFRALGPANGSTVDVAEQCTALGETATAGLAVAPMAANTAHKVGACMARIVGEGENQHGERYIVLDVGTGYGLRAGDRYRILGRSISADGFVPLGLASADDGRCMIDDDPAHVDINTARCVVLAAPPDRPALKNGYAVFVARP